MKDGTGYQTDGEAEYEWEVLPYGIGLPEDEAEYERLANAQPDYCLWMKHHQTGAWLTLSNHNDCRETFSFGTVGEVDELIFRLMKARYDLAKLT
jgi:hypothetical protein